MATALDALLEKLGKTRGDFAKKRGAQGSVFRRAGVSNSAELRRILDIPRRRWEDNFDNSSGAVAELVSLLTTEFKTPQGTQELWPVQAVILAELHDFGGAVGLIRTSGGKTLSSFLAPTAAGAERPLLLVPSGIADVTRARHTRLSFHWRLPPITVTGYSYLSREENAEYLNEFQPDLIIADESQFLKNLGAGVTKRVAWWMHDHPDTIFVPLSGTPTNRSLHEYAHLLRWALPKLCPVPRNYGDIVEWALCLDEGKDSSLTLAPGHLDRLYNAEEVITAQTDPLTAVRLAFQRRLCETPGVISASDEGLDVPIKIRAFDLDLDSPEIVDAFFQLRKYWRTPDGRPFAEASLLWAHVQELVNGLVYVWDPPAPKAWLAARQAWCSEVRHRIANNNRRLATEMQVAKAIVAGHYDARVYNEWVAIRDTFKPNSVPIWVHDVALLHARNWLYENPDGIAWTVHKAFGQKLSETSGVPYFGAKGLNKYGEAIEDAEGPVIASVRSVGVGRDLQKWNKNLVMSCTPNGEVWEQLTARTHRSGQTASEVTFEVFMACSEQYYGFSQAMRDAEYAATVLGQSRKLLRADVNIPSPAEVALRTSIRWQRGVQKVSI